MDNHAGSYTTLSVIQPVVLNVLQQAVECKCSVTHLADLHVMLL